MKEIRRILKEETAIPENIDKAMEDVLSGILNSPDEKTTGALSKKTNGERTKNSGNKIEPRLLQSFKRIRKNSRNGLGIVYVQRDACGGCFNKIPPQRQLDIRSRKKIIVCEYCGRIMIDPELAGITPEQKVEVVKEKPVRAKRKIVHIGSDN